jgi:O-antigen ligase
MQDVTVTTVVGNCKGAWRARAARLLEVTVFASLIALVALTLIPYGTVQAWWEAVFECAVFALVMLWLVEGRLSGRWRVRGLVFFAPLLAIVVFAYVQTMPILQVSGTVAAISADPYGTRLFAMKMLAVTLFGALSFRYASGLPRLMVLIHVVIGVGVASALFGILRQTLQHGAPDFILPGLDPGVGYGQFINRNHFAFLMEMALGLTIGLVAGGGVRRDRLPLYVAAAAPMWAALVLCNSRGGILGMLCQIVFVALLYGYVRRPEVRPERGDRAARPRRFTDSVPVKMAVTVCLLAAVAASVLLVGGDPLAERLGTLPGEIQGSDAARENVTRAEIWRATWPLIVEHPVVGVGFGGYWAAATRRHDASGDMTPGEAHNDYLELLASGGLVGAGLAAWFLYLCVKRARERLRSGDQIRRAMCFGAVAGLTTVGVHSFVDFGLHLTGIAVVCVSLLVIAAGDAGGEAREAIRP